MKLALIVLISVLPLSLLHGADLAVPGDYPTIRQAIDAASNGDSVVVSPGVYEERIDFLGKAITVRSSSGASVTTIDGQQLGSVASFVGNELPNSILEGFTLTNGSGTEDGNGLRHGGAIFCVNSSPTLRNNHFLGNDVWDNPDGGWGGAIYVENGSPTIEGNTFENNLAGQGGGGVACFNSNPVVRGNHFNGNRAIEYIDGTGGALYIQGDTVDIESNVFIDCSAYTGGAVYCEALAATITLNQFHENSGGGTDGGATLYLVGGANLSLNNFDDNIAFSNYGGGALVLDHATVVSRNDIMSNNLSTNHGAMPGSAILCESSQLTLISATITKNNGINTIRVRDSDVTIVNTILWGNETFGQPDIFVSGTSTVDVTYSDIQRGWSGVGNIDTNPLFINAQSDEFQLQAMSPCRDSGTNDVDLTETDWEGDDRIVRGTVDMGADEMAFCLIDFERFGQGVAGAGGIIPDLDANDSICEFGSVLRIRNGLGGASGFLWAGLGQTEDNPFYGGHFYIDFTQPWTFIPITLGGTPGNAGAGTLDLPTGDVEAFTGLTLYLQVKLFDEGSIYGVSLSNGLQMGILD